jgi:hypothetical protein
MNSDAPKYPRLSTLTKKLELPMLFLSFVWLCILITELAYGTNTALSGFGTGIWILFIFYFTMCLRTVANRISFSIKIGSLLSPLGNGRKTLAFRRKL